MMKVHVLTIENPISEEIKVRAVYSKKEAAMRAFKDLEKVFTDKKDPLGLIIAVDECKPNTEGEFIPQKRLVDTVI